LFNPGLYHTRYKLQIGYKLMTDYRMSAVILGGGYLFKKNKKLISLATMLAL
jgi:hypothetical protein